MCPNFLISFWKTTFDDSHEGNLKLKKLQDQHGESLSWTDYLSLPFTQTVRKP
ncbi:hypothetical protein JHK86_003727 [Glycine max]|nr:hypothetical protein JHK86_003727 [Glycine max]